MARTPSLHQDGNIISFDETKPDLYELPRQLCVRNFSSEITRPSLEGRESTTSRRLNRGSRLARNFLLPCLTFFPATNYIYYLLASGLIYELVYVKSKVTNSVTNICPRYNSDKFINDLHSAIGLFAY